eukprot:gene27862-31476_t
MLHEGGRGALPGQQAVPGRSTCMTLQIRVAQLNFVVGDMQGNARKIIDFATRAHAEGARLVLTPELSICGYAAEDLFLRPSFIDACDDALKTVARELAGLKGLHVVVGHPEGGGVRTRSVAVTRRHNRASVLCEGQVVCAYDKRELPNYQVFDERRYFTPGNGVGVFDVDGVRVGLLICEDAWFDEPARLARDAGAQLLAVLNASPFHAGKGPEREQRMRERVADCGLPLIYAHLVGGQDEVIFEGRSFALNAQGQVVARAEGFREAAMTLQVQAAALGVDLSAAPEALSMSISAQLVLVARVTRKEAQHAGNGPIVGLFRLLERLGAAAGPVVTGMLAARYGAAQAMACLGVFALVASLLFSLVFAVAGARDSRSGKQDGGVPQFFCTGNVDEGEHQAVNHIVDGTVRHDTHGKPAAAAGGNLLFAEHQRAQYFLGVFLQPRVNQVAGNVAQRPLHVAGDQLVDLGGLRGEAADVQHIVEEDG